MPSSGEGDLPPGVSKEDAARQFGRDKNTLAWKSNLKFNKDWNYQQKANYRRLLQHYNSEEYKSQQKEYLQK